MKKRLWFALSALILIMGLNACNPEDQSPNTSQTFSMEDLSIRINSVQWESIDLKKSVVIVSGIGTDNSTVELHSILQESPRVQLPCQIANLSNQQKDYTFEGRHQDPNYTIEVYGSVKDGHLDLRIEYDACYDITGKWMLAATSGTSLGLSTDIPDVSIEIRLPEDFSLDGETLPGEPELAVLLDELNTSFIMISALVDALEFTESGYVNLSLTPMGEESLGVQNQMLHGILQYYTQDRLYLYSRTSILMGLITEATMASKATGAAPAAPFYQMMLNYEMNGNQLRIYIDKPLLGDYITGIRNFIQNTDPQEWAALFALIGEDPTLIAEDLAYVQLLMNEIETLINHPDTHLMAEINLIPWTDEERPWSMLF